jgi:hypothetical protein
VDLLGHSCTHLFRWTALKFDDDPSTRRAVQPSDFSKKWELLYVIPSKAPISTTTFDFPHIGGGDTPVDAAVEPSPNLISC